MIKAFIIEDELMARRNIQNLLSAHFPYVEVIGYADSVRSSILWLTEHGSEADVIFMDVELSDGNCFEIFRSVSIKAKVIMTTAYDNHAVDAFKVNSTDYLLKPVAVEDMQRALSRVLESKEESRPAAPARTRENFLVKLGERIVPVPLKEVAYFYAEEKSTWLVTLASQRYIIDDTLDNLASKVPGENFFRISRSVIVSSAVIESVLRLPGGRLKLSPVPGITEFTELTVSRSRVEDFLAWL